MSTGLLLLRNVRGIPALILRSVQGSTNGPACRTSSSSSSSESNPTVVLADEGRTIVCWHPEPPFPYEYSLPLPTKAERSRQVLKSLEIEDRFKGMKEEFVRAELMKITHTTKHRWYPRARDKKAKKTPMDRPYL